MGRCSNRAAGVEIALHGLLKITTRAHTWWLRSFTGGFSLVWAKRYDATNTIACRWWRHVVTMFCKMGQNERSHYAHMRSWACSTVSSAMSTKNNPAKNDAHVYQRLHCLGPSHKWATVKMKTWFLAFDVVLAIPWDLFPMHLKGIFPGLLSYHALKRTIIMKLTASTVYRRSENTKQNEAVAD